MRETGIKPVFLFILFFLLLAISGQVNAEKQKNLVYVGIPPQAYLVERIAGGLVEAGILLAPGKSPATYEPTPKDIAGLASADGYFMIGVPFELKLMDKIQALAGDLKIIDTRKGVTLRPMAEHHHDPHIQHEGNNDPHIWLDPKLALAQCRTIGDGLKDIYPQYAEIFEDNLIKIENDLRITDSTISSLLDKYKGEAFYIFHPSLGYFADRYGLRQIAVETAGKEPGARELASLITQAKRDGIKAILVQQEFSSKTAQAIANEIDGKVITVNPLSRDYLNNLLSLAESIGDAMAGSK
jgi:zinc transport system substrate-binding protein